MIVSALLSFAAALMSFGLDIIPDWIGVPPFLENVLGASLDIMSAAASLSTWIPIPVVLYAIGFRFAVILGAISVKLLRMVLSLMTGGGGGAA